jgi:hypothetical protein
VRPFAIVFGAPANLSARAFVLPFILAFGDDDITGPFFLAMAGGRLLFGLGLVVLGKNGRNLIGISTVIGAIVLCCVPELLLGKYRNAKAHV